MSDKHNINTYHSGPPLLSPQSSVLSPAFLSPQSSSRPQSLVLSPRVSVVIASWNGLSLLQPCLAALARQTQAHELVVVDNGSRDGTADWVRQYVPDAHLLELPTNQGFASGYNAGMAAASGDLVVLLNNDTLPAPDAVAQLVAPFAAQPQLGATAGVLTFAHQPTHIASAGIVVGRDLVHRDLWATQPVSRLPATPTPIFGPSGGAVCYRRTALDDVGFFAPKFFAYLEDADLAWRLRLRGWTTLLMSQALVQHVYSATGQQGSPWKQRQLARNRWWVILRSVPDSILRRCWPHVLRYEALAIAYGLARRQRAMVAGRIAAFQTLSQLLTERRAIMARQTASAHDLARWLVPSLGPRATLAEARALDAILAQRPST